jgi:hypothetical protein
LRVAWGWVAAQFIGNALLILLVLAWTRLPDKHVWQVVLTLLVPVLLAICVLELHAATMRKLSDDEGKRIKLPWGALTLLLWFALGAALWWALDWCDSQIPLWAGYLNSKGSPHARVTWLSFEHVSRDLALVEWVLRWIAVPGKLIVLGTASAQWGWRFQWRRTTHVLLDWRWWPVVALAALAGVALPARWFAGIPTGSVSAQVSHVALKLAAAYLLAVGSWVLLLGWAAVLLGRLKPPPAEEVLVAVPVLAGPGEGSRTAAVEVPPPDEGD